MPLNPFISVPDTDLDAGLQAWLHEDIGRGDWTTLGLGALVQRPGQAIWVARAPGVVAGLPFAQRLFQRLEADIDFQPLVAEGDTCASGMTLAKMSGIATATRQYVEQLAQSPTRFVDTRKTTPGLRQLEKYASRVGGATNHRLGLDDAVMIKDNHIAAAGGIRAAVAHLRPAIPYPMTVEVETISLEQVDEALTCPVDIIMLDNMPPEMMRVAVERIRDKNAAIKIEASGNVTLATLGPIAATGVDFISSSAPITRAPWLDISMQINDAGG